MIRPGFAVSLALGITLSAQTAPALRFDVASVKVSTQSFLVMTPDRTGGRIHWTTDLIRVIGYAYRLQPLWITGPVPGSTSIYEFNVATNPDATDDQVRLMFQSLLADRFGMVAHRETREVEGWALTVAKGGPKMETAIDGKVPPLPEGLRDDPARMEGYVVAHITGPGVGNLTGRRVTTLQLSDAMQRILSAAVFDLTGLTGKYYFDLQYAAANASPDVNLPDLPAAVKDLGLKLEKHKGSVESLVVEHIEKIPTEN